MGQHYKAAIIGEKKRVKIISPRDFDSGSKLTEFSWCGNHFVNAVLSLIHNKRAKVAFIGDYANDPYDDTEDYYASVLPKESFEKYYQAAWRTDKMYTMRNHRFTEGDYNLLEMDTAGSYLINHDKGVFIDIEAYIENAKIIMFDDYWAVNPLPLLTACGNGRGGGDFSSECTGCDDVGIWAFATLEYTDKIPAGYTQVSYVFKEDSNG